MIGELQGVFRPVAFSLTLCLFVSLSLSDLTHLM